MIQKKNINEEGFTLIDLIVAVGIMTVLLLVGSIMISNIADSAKKAKEKADKQKDKETSLIETDDEVRFRK